MTCWTSLALGSGSSIPIVLAPTNLQEICESVIEEVSAAHPGKHLEVIYEGNLAGNSDSVKLGQVVSNLVANAIEHGAQREPVVLTVWGEDDRMPVAVHNEGAPITGATLENLGNLLAGRRLEERGTSTRVKLGLFIAREILAAHGGTLHATSSPTTGTTFTASWPRLIFSQASPQRPSALCHRSPHPRATRTHARLRGDARRPQSYQWE